VNWKLIFFIALIGYGGYQHFSQQPVSRGIGIMAGQQPSQNSIQQQSSNQHAFTHNGYYITPLEEFALEARVLAAKNYMLGREADLSPVDLALGWGKMSDEAILKDIKISQANRFYSWRVDQFPIPRKEIETQSANMHMIPATAQIEKTLKSVRPGQVVKLTGYLIEAKAKDGWRWKSSLTREDTGAGACELVFVKSLSVS
jgi:hypothetical protein